METYNKEKIKKYRCTPNGRAAYLLGTYNRSDKLSNRGKGDLTVQWIVENIFSKPCAHCGKTGWKVIGCNRLDNTKPHSKDNVEPCCRSCNAKEQGKDISCERSIKVDQIDQTSGEVVNMWQSAQEAARQLRLSQAHISKCCNGGFYSKSRGKWVNFNTYKGYIWRKYM